jgi:hypothetical protein
VNIVDGTLLFKDFKKGQVPSFKQFKKLQTSGAKFHKATNGGLASIEGQLGTFVKSSDADARYIKQSDAVVRGDGSVFSQTELITLVGKRVPVMTVPNLLAVEAENGKPRLFYVVNLSAGPISHTGCKEGPFGAAAGALQPGKHFFCLTGEEPVTVQLFTEGGNPTIATLTVSAIPTGQGEDAQYTAQVLVGT